MAASDVSICSNAALLLGGAPISSFGENTDRARLAANLFEPVRDYVLRRHPWKCATKRVTLAPDVATPGFDYGFQFTLPDDYLRVLSVGQLDDGGDPYEVEDGKILCDANPLYLRYIYRNTVVARWDAGLVWAMTMSMKAAFAYPTTASTSLEQLVDGALADVLKQARATDGQENPPEQFGDSPLMNARMGGRSWRG